MDKSVLFLQHAALKNALTVQHFLHKNRSYLNYNEP